MDVIVDAAKGFWLFGYGSVVWKVRIRHAVCICSKIHPNLAPRWTLSMTNAWKAM